MARETAISPSHIVFISRLVAFLETAKYSSIAQMKILIPISHNWEKCSVLWEKLCKLIQKPFYFLKTLWAKLHIGLFHVELFKLSEYFVLTSFPEQHQLDMWQRLWRYPRTHLHLQAQTDVCEMLIWCLAFQQTPIVMGLEIAFTHWGGCRYPSTSNPQGNFLQYPVWINQATARIKCHWSSPLIKLWISQELKERVAFMRAARRLQWES